MRKVAAGGLALFTFVASVVACSNFSGDEPPGTTPTGDGGADGGDSGGVPRDGFVLEPFPAEPLFVIQGKRIKLPVKIQRGANFQEPVAIVIPTPPKGITQLGNAIITGDTIDVEIEVDASFKQGVVELLLEARSERTVTQSAKPKLFVRGPSGSLDTTFGANGVLDSVFDPSMMPLQDAVVLPDRRIVFISRCQKSLFYTCTTRLSADGVIDTTYGTGGLSVSTNQQWGYLGALDGDKLVVVSGGGAYDSGLTAVASLTLSRLDANGQPDPTFGEAPKLGYWDYSNHGYMLGVAGISIDSSRRVLVAAPFSEGPNTRLNILRTTANGAPDPGFGVNGFAGPGSFIDYDPRGLAVVGDKVMVVGHGKSGNVLVARLGSDGMLDSAFGNFDGFSTFLSGLPELNGGLPLGVILGGDGSMLVPFEVGRFDVRVAKIAPDGKALVGSYASQGIASFGGSLSTQLMPTSNGKLLAFAGADIVRLDASGQLDTEFATNGRLALGNTAPIRMTPFGTDRVIVSGGKSASEKKPLGRRFWL